jgi:hypothetical protein
MEKFVESLKASIAFKDTTEVGDVVLMVNEPAQDGEPFGAAYAVITDFVRDPSKRDEWWFVHLTFLAIPPKPHMLILQRPHFTGREIFTMGGKKVFIQALDIRKPSEPGEQPTPPREPAADSGW